MMNQINKVIELVNIIKAGTTPQEIAKQIKSSLPPQIIAHLKNETSESIIEKLEPLVASFMGKESVALLKTEATTELLEQALTILKDD